MKAAITFSAAMGSWVAIVAGVACIARAAGSPDWEHATQGALLIGCLLSWVPLLIAQRLAR